MTAEMSHFFEDENPDTQVPRQIILSVKDTNIHVAISCQMKKLLESFKMKSEKEGRDYFRFWVDGLVQLQIGAETLEDEIEGVLEMMKPS